LVPEENIDMEIDSDDNIKVGSKDSKSVTITEVTEVVEYNEIEDSARVSKGDIEEVMREVKPKTDKKIMIGPPKLTRFEKARIVGARALQLSLGAPPLVVVPDDIKDSIRLAEYELEKRALPISIRRVLPDGKYQNIPITWLLD